MSTVTVKTSQPKIRSIFRFVLYLNEIYQYNFTYFSFYIVFQADFQDSLVLLLLFRFISNFLIHFRYSFVRDDLVYPSLSLVQSMNEKRFKQMKCPPFKITHGKHGNNHTI